ncbi:amidase [Nocardia sp. NPDC049149]|uniref:amidase n=1 Tax=Nocardia sp. NPDC049149 TaxID=3364315 RepID=UPI0037126282
MTLPAEHVLPSLTAAAAAMRRHELTATDLLDRVLATADKYDPTLGVYLTRFDERARKQAADADAKFAADLPLPPLAGIPVGVKDILAHSYAKTTAQSLVLDPAWGASVGDCTVVRRLEAAGAIVTGKVTTMEFAIGLPDPDKPFPIPRNPWDPARWAGGSSSGSASGVAAGMFLGAIGTDTGGSIRMPAFFTGTTGLKPTFGRVPKSGVVPLSYTLDHVGPIARSAADCALLLSVIAGHDAADPYSAAAPIDDYVGALTGDLNGITIGVDDLDRYATAGIDPLMQQRFTAAVDVLREAGATIVPIELPMYPEAMAVGVVVLMAESHAYHRRTLRSQWQDYGKSTRLLMAVGSAIGGADYVQAQRVRRIAKERMAELLGTVDLVVTPTGHLAAPTIDSLDQLRPLSILDSMHTPYWNPLGNPVLAVPIGLGGNKTPLSMSIAGRHFAEASVLRAGDAYQRRTDHHSQIPTAVR